MSLVVVGVDLATVTGLARLESGHLSSHGRLKISPNTICADVQSIAAFCAGADLVVVESTYMAANAATSMKLSELRGRLLQCLDAAGIKWTLCAPSTWRKTTIKPGSKTKRKELKRMAVAYVLDHYGVTVADDAADAVCLAEWGVADSLIRPEHNRSSLNGHSAHPTNATRQPTHHKESWKTSSTPSFSQFFFP